MNKKNIPVFSGYYKPIYYYQSNIFEVIILKITLKNDNPHVAYNKKIIQKCYCKNYEKLFHNIMISRDKLNKVYFISIFLFYK